MSQIVLPDTSLSAIVRDEMENPAGGIVDFVESIAPHVEEARIHDTGSRDGTYETLLNLRSRFPNLIVSRGKFKDYSQARNGSLKDVRTRRALVMDADERMKQEDLLILATLLDWNESQGFTIEVRDVFMDGSTSRADTHNPRLFDVDSFKYKRPYREVVTPKKSGQTITPTSATIYHFQPSKEALELKRDQMYGTMRYPDLPSNMITRFMDRVRLTRAPSRKRSFRKWKAPNPHREAFR